MNQTKLDAKCLATITKLLCLKLRLGTSLCLHPILSWSQRFLISEELLFLRSCLWDNWYPMCFIWDIQCRINGGKSNLNWNVEKFQNIMSRILGKQFRCCFFYFSSWTCDKTDVSANKVTKWIVNCNGRR